ncbi:MAG: sensor histidine kinase [Cyanobacteria bacterium P01_H01_bin.21]
MLRLPALPRLMLILEWILLGVAVFSASIIGVIDVSPQFPVLTMVCMGVFAMMGLEPLWLKPLKHSHTIGYTLVEFGLIGLPLFFGKSMVTFPHVGMVLVLRSAQRFGLWGRLGVAVGAYALFVLNLFVLKTTFINPLSLVTGNNILPTDINLLTLKLVATVYFGMMLCFILLFVNALVSEHQGRERLSITLSQLRDYSLRIEDQAALQERNRIAREIHDSLGHTLIAQSVQLDSGLHLLSTHQIEPADTFFHTAKLLCAQALQEVRQSVVMLRSDYLRDNSLESAIATLIQDFQTTTAIIPEMMIDVSQPFSLEISSTAYRIVQAALTNITRHSNATAVTLQITTRSGMLYIVIKDNGQGFNLAQNSTGFGLLGMRERAMALNGQFNLISEPGAGCLITVQIPLPRAMA